ncbi:MAG: hypothetical protein JRJ50_13990 [Deltaproteobacteria bacterium]|nr:hypothetical protein [Deltaproteobacteria bacterium]
MVSKENKVWAREGFDRENDLIGESLLKLELPLLAEENKTYGTLWLIKDLKRLFWVNWHKLFSTQILQNNQGVKTFKGSWYWKPGNCLGSLSLW